MQTQRPNWVQYTLLVLLVVVVVFAYFWIPTLVPEVPVYDVPTAAEIAALVVIPEVVIPEFNIPDTMLSVRDTQKDIARDLVEEELNTRDVKELLSEALNECEDTDMDRHDITEIVIKDVDYRVLFDRATLDLELKVYYDNFGDEAESARVDMKFRVTDLDRDDDYEDAEVDEFVLDSEVYSCSTD